MAMGKGLSPREVEDIFSVSQDCIDIVKLDWSTSFISPGLQKKMGLYHQAGISAYFGENLFETFYYLQSIR